MKHSPSVENTEDLERRKGRADVFAVTFTRNDHLDATSRLYVAMKAGERVGLAKPGHVGLAVAIEMRRGPVVLNELEPGRNDALREAAAVIAEPIAERHGVSVGAIFGRSLARYVTAARDELCAELLAREWSQADVARALGMSGRDPARGAARHRSRVMQSAQGRTAAHG